MGWCEVADLVVKRVSGAIEAGIVTDDLARLLTKAQQLGCSGLGNAPIAQMQGASHARPRTVGTITEPV